MVTDLVEEITTSDLKTNTVHVYDAHRSQSWEYLTFSLHLVILKEYLSAFTHNT